MKVRYFMTQPAKVMLAHLPVRVALGSMLAHKLHRMPVVAASELIGMVSQGDLVGAVLRDERRVRGTAITVGEVMTRHPYRLGPEDNLDLAVRIMTDRRVTAIPVVENGRVVGILTQTDVVRACRMKHAGGEDRGPAIGQSSQKKVTAA